MSAQCQHIVRLSAQSCLTGTENWGISYSALGNVYTHFGISTPFFGFRVRIPYGTDRQMDGWARFEMRPVRTAA